MLFYHIRSTDGQADGWLLSNVTKATLFSEGWISNAGLLTKPGPCERGCVAFYGCLRANIPMSWESAFVTALCLKSKYNTYNSIFRSANFVVFLLDLENYLLIHPALRKPDIQKSGCTKYKVGQDY